MSTLKEALDAYRKSVPPPQTDDEDDEQALGSPNAEASRLCTELSLSVLKNLQAFALAHSFLGPSPQVEKAVDLISKLGQLAQAAAVFARLAEEFDDLPEDL